MGTRASALATSVWARHTCADTPRGAFRNSALGWEGVGPTSPTPTPGPSSTTCHSGEVQSSVAPCPALLPPGGPPTRLPPLSTDTASAKIPRGVPPPCLPANAHKELPRGESNAFCGDSAPPAGLPLQPDLPALPRRARGAQGPAALPLPGHPPPWGSCLEQYVGPFRRFLLWASKERRHLPQGGRPVAPSPQPRPCCGLGARRRLHSST